MNEQVIEHIHATEGFMFSEDRERVVLIQKDRPIELYGKLVGVGGKVEPGETAAECVSREFWEEAGVKEDSWQHVITKTVNGMFGGKRCSATIDVFRCWGDVRRVYSKTSERVNHYAVNNIPAETKQDTKWSIAMALDDKLFDPTLERTVLIHKVGALTHV